MPPGGPSRPGSLDRPHCRVGEFIGSSERQHAARRDDDPRAPGLPPGLPNGVDDLGRYGRSRALEQRLRLVETAGDRPTEALERIAERRRGQPVVPANEPCVID